MEEIPVIFLRDFNKNIYRCLRPVTRTKKAKYVNVGWDEGKNQIADQKVTNELLKTGLRKVYPDFAISSRIWLRGKQHSNLSFRSHFSSYGDRKF